MTEAFTVSEHPGRRLGRSDASGAVEDLRLAEGQLERRRRRECGPSSTAREALRLISDAADEGAALTPSALARGLQISSPSVSNIVRTLTGSGLVSAVASDSDHRSKVLMPMDRHLDVDSLDPLNRSIRAMADALSDDDAAAVTRFLASVRELIDRECR